MDENKVAVGVTQPFYILWVPSGNTAPRIVYRTAEEARPEAERLSRKTNSPVYVMRSFGFCAPAEPPVIWRETEIKDAPKPTDDEETA